MLRFRPLTKITQDLHFSWSWATSCLGEQYIHNLEHLKLQEQRKFQPIEEACVRHGIQMDWLTRSQFSSAILRSS